MAIPKNVYKILCYLMITAFECVWTLRGTEFIGTSFNKTRSGYGCQAWTVDTPNLRGKMYAGQLQDDNIEHNYCRQPGILDTYPWCYALTGVTWERCNMPYCPGYPWILCWVSTSIDMDSLLSQILCKPSAACYRNYHSREPMPRKIPCWLLFFAYWIWLNDSMEAMSQQMYWGIYRGWFIELENASILSVKGTRWNCLVSYEPESKKNTCSKTRIEQRIELINPSNVWIEEDRAQEIPMQLL